VFTGIVEATGEVLELRTGASQFVRLRASEIVNETAIGESVAINGCCLTITSRNEDELTFDLLAETLSRTNLGSLQSGDRVNLERALPANGRIGGHFVQGHIDCASRVVAFDNIANDWRLEIDLPSQFSQYVVAKGSIALNGVSLTVAELGASSFVVWIIPHTYAATNLSLIRPGDAVNVEFDLLAKYVERQMIRRGDCS
jgi:riboflavin synthase